MATTHTFEAKSVEISVSNEPGMSGLRECRLLGRFVLNGNVNKEGAVFIKPTAADRAIFFPDPPELKIEFILGARFEALSQLLCAAGNVRISFVSNTDLSLAGGGHVLEYFDILPGRTYE